jgi:Gly-Xaa carboxypeptidase
MAHQDVVPVPVLTQGRWTYPPWSGHEDGNRIWGRGSSIPKKTSLTEGANDCKNNLLGILDCLEFLLDQGFQPKRTIVAAFGFDEEISGFHGAEHISTHLLSRYGKDSFEFILDEGGSEVRELYGGIFALPGTAEKALVLQT